MLDLIPVRSGQTTAQAVAASVSLAQTADRLGYTRFWVAEHHNMPSVASTTPSTVIAHLAAATERIRLGSGGVMLPNHAPLAVAEQFALLEAMHPGRIDLGIGRAPGSDPVTAYMLRGRRGPADADPAADFPTDVETVAALLGADRSPASAPFGDDQPGVALTIGARNYDLKATPRSASAPQVWLLGSSDYSASLAAQLGLAFVYANHFGAPGIDRALDLYRSGFRPSEALDAPRTLLTVNASVAEDDEAATLAALPQLITMARLRTGGTLAAQLTIDEAQATTLSPAEQASVQEQSARWMIGTPRDVAERIRQGAERYGVDEVMVSPAGGAWAAQPLTSTPSRERTLALLAAELLVPAKVAA